MIKAVAETVDAEEVHSWVGEEVVLGAVAVMDVPIDDEDAVEAERFACTVLTGEPCPSPRAVYGLTAPKLVIVANRAGRTKRVDPGVHALVYGRNAGRMGVAQNALKLMGLDRGARTVLSAALHRHLPEELPETTERFVSLTAA